MKLRMFQVDAFADRVFAGNPAAVCPLHEWLPEDRMQAMARENNLSETAFLVERPDAVYGLRWFTPTTEVDLCGHATLASAYVLWNCLGVERDPLRFDTRSGRLEVGRRDAMIALRFPEAAIEACPNPPEALATGLGAPPVEVHMAGTGERKSTYLAVFGAEDDIRRLDPDFRVLTGLGDAAVIATAPGGDADFVSRYFAPAFGIDEDPVTGSAHCALTPYWSERLGKTRLHARQVSARGGELFCERRDGGVVIAGRAVLYMEATVTV